MDVTATVISNYNGSQIQCFGDSSGVAVAVASGGTVAVDYQYTWSVTTQTTDTALGLPDGTFVVTVTDDLGCSDTAVVTLVDPSSVVATITTFVPVSCLGDCNGSATVSGSGGTGIVYTFQWDAAALNQTTGTATGLCAGLYAVTVSDANGCVGVTSVNITEPSTAINATAVVSSNFLGQDVSCNNAFDGAATASAVGGTPGYTFLWSGSAASGQTTDTAVGLGAGTYCVTVSDALGCPDSACVTLTEPAAVIPNVDTTIDVLCFGDSTGSATVSATGGTAPYSFLWEVAANSQTTATATGLLAGSYTVTVSDANLCQGVAVIVVGQPSGVLNVTALVTSNYPGGTPLQCFGDSSGTALATITGGSSPYSIIWNIGAQTTAAISGLPAGTFCVFVTDSLGCSDTACITLSAPVLLTASVSSNDALCRGEANGSATVTGSGGTGGYTFLWDVTAGSQTTATATGLAAGVYPVTVTDANGCVAVSSAVVGEPATGVNVALLITSNYNGANVSCNGVDDATINASASGGSVAVDYDYIWSVGLINNPLVNVGAGQHCVTVTDDNGCSATDCITVTEPSAVTATIVTTSSVTCFGTCTGTATVAGAGGTTIAGYSFLWDAAAGNQTTPVALNLCAGSYNVTVTDANGCSGVAVAVIGTPASALTTSLNATSNYNGQQISCAGSSDGELTATVTGGTGTGTYIFSWSSNPSTTNLATGLSVAGNSHCVFVEDSLGCRDTACFDLIEPNVVSAIISNKTDVTCNGGTNGSATVSPAGGTGAFTYIWDNLDSTSTATTLTAGVMCVTVSDANGCSASTCTNITEPTLLTTTAAINSNYNGENVSCAGACDGIVFATGTGGTLPYQSYTWSTPGAGIGDTMTVACAGSVDVTVTDANGCTATASVTLTEPSAVTATITASNDATCNGQCDGDATVVGAGGTVTTGYTFLWSVTANNQTTAIATGLCSGTHTVTVTDNNGCSNVTSVFINQPALGVSATATVTSNYNGSDVTCIGDCDGEVTAIGSGGTVTTGYTFLWDANTGYIYLINNRSRQY
ncbi:SprB repeat-containing protein [Aureispira]|nr:SprB repeat-containing protein [Aureispira sp.]